MRAWLTHDALLLLLALVLIYIYLAFFLRNLCLALAAVAQASMPRLSVQVYSMGLCVHLCPASNK